MNVSDLTVAHLGKTVRVSTGTNDATGILYAIDLRAERIDDTRMFEPEPRYVAGPVKGHLTVGTLDVPVRAHSTVEVLA